MNFTNYSADPNNATGFTSNGSFVEIAGVGKDETDVATLQERFRKDPTKCPKCSSGPLPPEERVVDGCRFNGDAYGRYITRCPNAACSWFYSVVWDDY